MMEGLGSRNCPAEEQGSRNYGSIESGDAIAETVVAGNKRVGSSVVAFLAAVVLVSIAASRPHSNVWLGTSGSLEATCESKDDNDMFFSAGP